MKLEVYKVDGTKSGEKITLPDEIFGIEPHHHAIYQAVRLHLAAKRQGTHKVKGRSEVRGGGRKPWRQKGTGRARVGTIRSPLWVGGGAIHGPQPRDYSFKLPKKVKELARKSALSQKVRDEQIRIVEDFSFEEAKTKQMSSLLTAHGLERIKTTLVLAANDKHVTKSGRNIPNLAVLEARNASTYELLDNRMLLIQKSAIEVLSNGFPKTGAQSR
jgi:large subunit ribosomal protein L4